MANEAAPFSMTLGATIDAAIAAADSSGAYVVAPFAGVVSAASVIAATLLTGANTESRTLQLHNRGAAGAGTTLVASKAFVSGVNAAADDETALTLSATAADLVVAEGDVLEFTSLHVGATGLAASKMLGKVTFSRVAGA
jgi:hypothetical protein